MLLGIIILATPNIERQSQYDTNQQSYLSSGERTKSDEKKPKKDEQSRPFRQKDAIVPEGSSDIGKPDKPKKNEKKY